MPKKQLSLADLDHAREHGVNHLSRRELKDVLHYAIGRIEDAEAALAKAKGAR